MVFVCVCILHYCSAYLIRWGPILFKSFTPLLAAVREFFCVSTCQRSAVSHRLIKDSFLFVQWKYFCLKLIFQGVVITFDHGLSYVKRVYLLCAHLMSQVPKGLLKGYHPLHPLGNSGTTVGRKSWGSESAKLHSRDNIHKSIKYDVCFSIP